MQINETVHGCPVAVVHPIVRVEILAFQVKSGPPRDRRLWLRPAGRAMMKTDAKRMIGNLMMGVGRDADGSGMAAMRALAFLLTLQPNSSPYVALHNNHGGCGQRGSKGAKRRPQQNGTARCLTQFPIAQA